jgi:hypothetical protein
MNLAQPWCGGHCGGGARAGDTFWCYNDSVVNINVRRRHSGRLQVRIQEDSNDSSPPDKQGRVTETHRMHQRLGTTGRHWAHCIGGAALWPCTGISHNCSSSCYAAALRPSEHLQS